MLVLLLLARLKVISTEEKAGRHKAPNFGGNFKAVLIFLSQTRETTGWPQWTKECVQKQYLSICISRIRQMANLAGENRKSGESPAVSSASASRREERGNLKLGERRSLLIFIGLFFCLHAASPIHERSPKRGSFWAHLCFWET